MTTNLTYEMVFPERALQPTSEADAPLQISVLMPAKNAESTIRAAISSTLRALPSDAELLIFDDASSDQTSVVARSSGDSRVKVFSSDEPHGVARALNRLFSESEGSLIARMDADDISLPWRFHSQKRAIARGIDVSFGSVVHFGDSLRLPRLSPPATLRPDAMRLSLLISNAVAHSTMMCTRQVLETAGGYHDCLAEDYELWLRLARSGSVRISRSGLPLIALRRHAGQVTKNGNWAAKAASQPEWQLAYRELAESIFVDSWSVSLAARIDGSPLATAKARVLAPLISAQTARLPGPDRYFVRQLAKRNGISLPANKSDRRRGEDD